ncbi:uncharacterized protein [Nicotiana sylvestris]|uniref:uncharacterized protein n=1 Tax=Nicotiana sylvestris TaxID=4096 RepID=UPI00388C7F91
MAAPLNFEEGQSIYHPPKFDGKCYWWWKARMHDFIMAKDCELWDVIYDDLFVPIKSEADKKAVEKNFRAKKILVYGLGPKEYDRISTCDTAKEIWEALQINYEGTTQVKQDKSDTDDNSTMVVEGEEIGYDSTLSLMAQSNNDEDNDNEEKTIEILRKEKSELLVETAGQRELIVKPLTNSKPESSERGKGIVSEEYFRLEDEMKALRYRMCAEIEKNELLQTNLEKVMNDLESEKGRGAWFPREKTPHKPHSKSATASDNWPRTQCGNTGHFKEGVHAKNQSVQKDKVVAETVTTKEGPGSTHKKYTLPGTMKGNGQQWFMDNGCLKHMTGNTTDFLSLKALQRGSVSLGNDKKGYILGVGKSGDLSCLKAVNDDVELWHIRLGHASFSLLNKLIQKDLVHGLPMSQFKTQKVCDSCARGKHVKSSFKSKRDVSTSKPLELLHMDLCGPMRVQSSGGKRYIFVIVDDYSRFTRTLFLRTKDETVEVFVAFLKKIQVKMESKVVCIRSDHGTEFDNIKFDEFCNENGIT